jgi:hypothetical protein
VSARARARRAERFDPLVRTQLEILESEFQRQVVDLARQLGWEHAHFRKARTKDSWRTPVSGGLGKGWPDLVLVHPGKRRLIVAELKSQKRAVTPDQKYVLAVLGAVAEAIGDRFEVHVWRPGDLEAVSAALLR